MSALQLNIPDGVELVKTAEPARWATERMRPWGDARTDLWTFMPSGYNHYIRVLHPLADRGGDRSFRWAEFARPDSLPIKADASLKDVVAADVMDQGWLDQYRPREGSMPQRTCERLTSVLRRFTSTPDTCWMAVWDGWGGWWPGGEYALVSPKKPNRIRAGFAQPKKPTRIRARFARASRRHRQVERAMAGVERVERPLSRFYFLFRAPIDKAWSFHNQTPQLWWGEDRSWFVSTEIDGFSTYVGCAPDCADALLGSGDLETVEVPLDVRLW
jgi:hypothetical protein